MSEIKRLRTQLKVLLRIETQLRKKAQQVAKPFELKANKVHRDWVKTYNRLKDLDRPKTLDDAWGESTTLHGCNPCH